MNTIDDDEEQSAFAGLTPDRVISLVEAALDRELTNLFRSLNSYINRVYELEGEDGSGFIAKFYRPGRWSRDALEDEQDFLLALAEDEIPVIPPLPLRDGGTLGRDGDLHFAVFPKKSGRVYDEYSPWQWHELGRLLGRVHAVGSRQNPRDRITMAPEKSTRDQVDYILEGDFLPPDLAPEFSELTGRLIDEITPVFEGVENITIHGDCHYSNLIYRPGESFFIIDFDDMAVGPPVQDFWMLLPGYRRDSAAEIEDFLEGYEVFRSFDRRTLRLIGPLRAMRYIHYMAWCAHQVAEDGSSPVSPDFGSRGYWLQEIRDLGEQIVRIRASLQR
jgi:Ser/Thr protein kinase RdoA (MazF antagonist)